MTFPEFQATRVASDNLPQSLPDMYWDLDFSHSGLVYLDMLYIETVDASWPAQARERGAWYLILNNDEFISDDLALLELRLYDFAKAEGYLEN